MEGGEDDVGVDLWEDAYSANILHELEESKGTKGLIGAVLGTQLQVEDLGVLEEGSSRMGGGEEVSEGRTRLEVASSSRDGDVFVEERSSGSLERGTKIQR